MAGDKTKSDPF